MKTHIVFDTEDREGMAATVKIIDHLAEKYMGRTPADTTDHLERLRLLKLCAHLRNRSKRILILRRAILRN